MKRARRRVVVTKRDGTLECFSLPKLRSCLTSVLRAVAADGQPADPLARAVACHLRQWDDQSLPSTGYVYRCVRTALLQTGLTEAADEFAAHRRLRTARRRRVRVLDPTRPEQPAVRWRKAALVETLQNVYDLRQSVARFLAGCVEGQVFSLGYRLLSKTLVAELLRNEVLAWGLLNTPVGVTRSHQACNGPVASRQPEKET